VTTIVACLVAVAPPSSVTVTFTVLVPGVANACVTSSSVAPSCTGPSPKSQLYFAIAPSGSKAQTLRCTGTPVPAFGGASSHSSGGWLPSWAVSVSSRSVASPSSSVTRTRTLCWPAVAKLRTSVDAVSPATSAPSTNQR
jgi:hypothetical protein